MYFVNQAGTKPLTTKNIDYETRGVSPFLAWGDFHAARVSLALLSLRKNGGLLVVYEKYNSKERVALSHCFIVLHIRRSRKLIYLNEENLPLKRVGINPAYNTFVRLVLFLVWFLFQLLL